MTSLLVVAMFLLIINHLALRDRVKRLESGSKSGELESLPLPEPLPTIETPLPLPRYEPQFVAEGTSRESGTVRDWFFVKWFKEYTLIKIGGILFFLGAAWFVTYAVSVGWLSPTLRITLGFLLALFMYGLGRYRARFVQGEYLLLTALGTAITVVTVLAAEFVFSMFPTGVTLGVVALAVLYTVCVSLQTQTLWLALLSATAGLMAPLFVDVVSLPLSLLLYLLVLSASLLFVSLRLEWRVLTLVLSLGVFWYESLLMGSASPMLLWSFVIIFSLLFFGSVTLSLTRSVKPQGIDIATLCIVSLGYVLFAVDLLENESLGVFIATAVIGSVGYLLMQRGFPAQVVAVYLALAAAGVLLGSALLFSGSTLGLVLTIEITSAFFLATYLGMPERTVTTIAVLYGLPLLWSLASLGSYAWQDGAMHPDALAVYTMLAALVASTLWLIHKPGVAIYQSSHSIVASFGIITVAYAYAVLAVMCEAIFPKSDWFQMMYVLWALTSLSVMYYALKQALPVRVVRYAAASLLIPIGMSFSSFFAPEWNFGLQHSHSFGLLGIVSTLLLTVLLLTQQYYREYDLSLRRTIGYFVFGGTLYFFAVIALLWQSSFGSALAIVATYVSYALVLYAYISIFVLVQAQLAWQRISLLALALPVLLSLDSIALEGFADGALSPAAVGLFALMTILLLLALGLRQRAFSAASKELRSLQYQSSRLLFAAATLYGVSLLWSLMHTFVARTEAISLSLLVYTVVGLLTYLYGKHSKQRDLSYFGVALLVIVVLRLLLIDIWNMELVWRFITLLSIGSLFIGAAFFERRPPSE